MKFDIKRVYSAVNAGEVKVGSKVICANTITDLKKYLEEDDVELHYRELKNILTEDNVKRFRVQCPAFLNDFALCYLISEPEEKKLKWTDLKCGDVIKDKYGCTALVVVVDPTDDFHHILIGNEWLTDIELKEWEKVE